jgi:hypothetical protein
MTQPLVKALMYGYDQGDRFDERTKYRRVNYDPRIKLPFVDFGALPPLPEPPKQRIPIVPIVQKWN